MLSDQVDLRGWHISVDGKDAALNKTRKNFGSVQDVKIVPLRVSESEGAVAAELRTLIDGRMDLRVVGVVEFDAQGALRSIRAYKGRPEVREPHVCLRACGGQTLLSLPSKLVVWRDHVIDRRPSRSASAAGRVVRAQRKCKGRLCLRRCQPNPLCPMVWTQLRLHARRPGQRRCARDHDLDCSAATHAATTQASQVLGRESRDQLVAGCAGRAR